MIWPAAVLVANALFGAAAPAGASGDRLAELNGAWTCRSEYGYPGSPAVCVVADLPAVALTAGDPDVPWPGAESGTVQVLVSLDADSKIVSTRIVSSPSVLLSASAVSVARRSTFHTALRTCRPVASTLSARRRLQRPVTR